MPDRPGHLVIGAATVQRLLDEHISMLRLRYRDDGDLAEALDEPGGEPGDALRVTRGDETGPGVVCRVVDGRPEWFADGEPLPATVVPERADVFDRVRGIFETDVLAGKAVAVLGLGSGGSFIVRELARSGVGRFLLVDDDRLEISNVCRHECGLSDVGRLKTNAVRDMVLDRHPAAEITTSPLRIGNTTIDALTDRLAEFAPDVVVCATDNRASRLLVNRICVLAGLPAIYAGVFRRAYGGQVLRVVPGLSPCYQCFVSALPGMAGDREVSSDADAAQIAYSDRPVAVEPGLSSDIVPVSLQVAKLALLELLQGVPTTLGSLHEDLVAPLYLWLNRREPGTEYATLTPMTTGVDELSILRWYGIGLARNEQCPVCGISPFSVYGPEADLDR
ncbi:HesA/MoeB/ThiF family protein [Dactylosporangium sp. NPDC051541]|uniref:HesA/MoeB/ThiF family protein n=1 Tax=Dactylosporangium sp. NPDC051541 TaxID=3363977 RepID=UPI00379D79AF